MGVQYKIAGNVKQISQFKEQQQSKLTESKDENITFQDYNSSKFTTNQSVNRQNVFVTGANNVFVAPLSDEKLKISSHDHSYHEANYPEGGTIQVKDLDSLTEE